VKLFIGHGGMNSTYEGLLAGKPILCVPFSIDQPTVAQHLVDRGLGLKVSCRQLAEEPGVLVEGIREVLGNAGFTVRAEAVRERLVGMDPQGRAVQLIEAFAEG
jgi:UDP:flavonoid glycosyltransferase YjiC (YdhE family)